VDREGVEREAAGAKGAAEQHPRGQKGELMLIRDTYVIFFRYYYGSIIYVGGLSLMAPLLAQNTTHR
jgi:hypothetical protein